MYIYLSLSGEADLYICLCPGGEPDNAVYTGVIATIMQGVAIYWWHCYDNAGVAAYGSPSFNRG